MTHINHIRTPVTEHGTVYHEPLSVSGLGWVNGALAALALGALVFYVVQANALAAHAWQMRDAQEQLAEARDARTALVAEQSSFDNRQRLTALAADLGMVPAADIVYLTPERPVAAR